MNHPIEDSDEPSRRRPTIADVAKRAGVSPALVSFAFNDRPGVSADTRERILIAAQELRWRPSASARALTQARTRTIGLVLSRRADELEVDSFFVRFLSGAERTLARADYAMLLQLVPATDAAGALGAYERLSATGRVDGFLLTDPELDDPRFPLLVEAAVPVVIAGRPATEAPFPWLETEHDRGITLAVEHLIGLGHERIGFLGGPEAYEHVQRRFTRWREALRGAHRAEHRVVFTNADLSATAARVLEHEPTAVVCTSDTLAISLIQMVRERGMSVPDHMSVIGFDDSLLATLSSPALTSVRVDYTAFGAAASAALLAVIDGVTVPSYRPSPPTLEVRASTAAPNST
jgi:LacI family transcriptional regulator, repressor for deo operon, udp, cdd, tsx, nupC, and nupG